MCITRWGLYIYIYSIHMHIQTHAHIRIIYIYMSKRKNEYVYLYMCVIVYDKHTAYIKWLLITQNTNWNMQNMYVHLGNIFQTYFFGIRRESRWQQFLNLESSGWKKNLETRADHTTVEKMLFLASVTSHWSRTLCSWWPALARVPGWEKLSILCCLGKPLTAAGVMISSRGSFLIEKGMSHFTSRLGTVDFSLVFYIWFVFFLNISEISRTVGENTCICWWTHPSRLKSLFLLVRTLIRDGKHLLVGATVGSPCWNTYAFTCKRQTLVIIDMKGHGPYRPYSSMSFQAKHINTWQFSSIFHSKLLRSGYHFGDLSGPKLAAEPLEQNTTIVLHVKHHHVLLA